MKTHTWLLLSILVILLTGCGGFPPRNTPTPTITPIPTDTPTPTPPPLTSQEKSYFDAVYRLRDQYDRDLLDWSLIEDLLKDIKAPAALAATHKQLLTTLTEANFAASMFKLSMMTYLLSNCSFSSTDYFLCKQREDNARRDAEKYATQTGAAKARFRIQWEAAQLTWDNYLAEHGVESAPTVTPFPLPPVTTPGPRGTAVAGVLGVEVVVTAVNPDAWSVIKAESSSNDAPKSGNKYIMVTVRVVNRGSEHIWVDASQFSIYANGTFYEESEQTNSNDFEAKELGPGWSTGGNLSFEVPNPMSTASQAVLLYLSGDVVMALE